MTQHDHTQHQHDHHEHGHEHHHPGGRRGRGIHRSPGFWLAVILMLGAMGAYLLSMDESIPPGAIPSGQAMPAAPGPPAPVPA
ncbi:MAG TPA: hypothetical protein VHV08_14010, partial [Pirellulales bacterium]|nr:hypothetical protein [Pirellulales bacterium]